MLREYSSSPKKLDTEYSYDPAIALLDICSKGMKAETQRDFYTLCCS
jgi:hypothetical protein